MAGDWLPMRLDVGEDPSVIAIAAAVGITEDEVVGKLHRLWSWANRHLTSGHAPGVTELWIDRFLGATGFAAAMLSAGWLHTRSGSVEFPNYDRWNSQSAKNRLLAARRQQRNRSRKRHDENVTKALPEKRREEKKDKPPPSAGGGGKKPRDRDPLFDAVAEVTVSDPALVGSHIAKIRHRLAKADPPYSPEDVREFGRRFEELCDWARGKGRPPALEELLKNISKLRATGPAMDPEVAARYTATRIEDD